MNFEDLKNPELQEKLKEAKTEDELVELAREGGVEMTDTQLEAVTGGSWSCDDKSCSRYVPCNDDGPF